MADPTVFVTLSELKVALGIEAGDTTFDAKLTAMLLGATRRLEVYLNNYIVAREYVQYFYGGVSAVRLDRYPYVSVASVVDPAANPIDPSEYTIRGDEGLIVHDWGFPNAVRADGGVDRWIMTYDGGLYQLDSDVEEEFKESVKLMVNSRFSRPDPTVLRRRVGDLEIEHTDPTGSEHSAYLIEPAVADLSGGYVNRGF